jgi:hypothetical protein
MVRQKIPDDEFKLICTTMGTVELFLKLVNSNGTLPRNSNKQHGFFSDMGYKNGVGSNTLNGTLFTNF